MRAAVCRVPHEPLTIESVDIDRPMAREALVRTAASGVCHSDLHFVEGLYPIAAPAILGHEAAGVVEEVGEFVTYVQGKGGVATVIPFGTKIELDGWAFLQGARTIRGSSMGSNRFRVDMPRYIDFYLQGRLKLDEMITRAGRLEDVNEAFRAMKAGEVARTVLLFG